jgi:peptidoglycan/LPS O-acetylase OafA/YrhL
LRRIPELDALRGIAAIVIVVFHVRFVDAFPALGTAVDLFFVLSGYLITTIILEQGRAPGFFRTFYIRRALRIWPIYYLALLACLALNPLLARPEPLGGFWYYAAYLQNVPGYWHAETPPFSRLFQHSWTLAIEEQFYLIWPALILLAGRRRVVPLAAGLVAFAVFLRARGYSVSLLGARCDGLALGGLLAGLLEGRGQGTPTLRKGFACTAVLSFSLLIALSATVGVGAPRGKPPWPVLTLLAFNTLWFGLIGLVATATGQPRLAILRSKRLRQLGTISYGLYLYHLIIMILSIDLFRSSGLRIAPIWREVPTIALCFAAAMLSWKYIERPILGFKDYFAYNHEPSGLHGSRRKLEQINRRERRGPQMKEDAK